MFRRLLVTVRKSSCDSRPSFRLRSCSPLSSSSSSSSSSNSFISFSSPHSAVASFSSTAPVKTGVVMLNMGGPASSSSDDVRNFLMNLFNDSELLQLGGGSVQQMAAKFFTNTRLKAKCHEYQLIGGGSPIHRWTQLQAQQLTKRLNKSSLASSSSSPSPSSSVRYDFSTYIAFRYVPPNTEQALLQMKKDGIKRAIAFSQYPQYSCTTTGSSLNELWRTVKRLKLENEFQWSIIDRWYHHPGFVDAVADRIRAGLSQFEAGDRSRVVIVFSAHSIPMKVVDRADPYIHEIHATVHEVMQRLSVSNPFIAAWQSKVGFLPWMSPSTSQCLENLAKAGHQHVLAVPIAFTSDHIETLYEIDVQYAELAAKAGIKHFKRAPSLNDSPILLDAMANLCETHLARNEASSSPLYKMKCAACTNPQCRNIINPVVPFQNLLATPTQP